MLQILCNAVQYFLRYRNQNLPLNSFEYKTGNVISVIFFSVNFLLILISIFFSGRLNSGILIFLLLISASSLVLIIASGIITQKETKLILLSIYLALSVFTLTAFLNFLLNGYKKYNFIKNVFLTVLIFLGCVVTIFIYILNFSDNTSQYFEKKQKADAAVILGAAVWGGNRPSPVLKERINKGYDIYHRNIVGKIVITGGGSPNELTEGEVSKNTLIKYGVEPDNLILENSSGSTVEQIHFVRDSLYHNFHWKKIILVSDLFHLPRAIEICRFNDLDADCIASEREISDAGALTYSLKESLALIIFWMYGV